MRREAKQILKIATAIHDRLKLQQAGRATYVVPRLPVSTWTRCEINVRQHWKAQQLGWRLVSRRLEGELRHQLRELQQQLATLEEELQPDRKPPAATIQDIAIDLVELQAEFEEVEFDLRSRTISVTTEPIELEGQYLGPFTIKLDWTDLAGNHPNNYQVIAEDPQPATCNEGVTHPHVQDESVCEGDGRQPIKNALKEARLFDFFTLVANLLRTYNSASPYVALSDWYGIPCNDCDHVVGDGDRYICDYCDCNVCGECITNCTPCDGIYCGGCSGSCDKCQDRYCGSCRQFCEEREKYLCPNCRDQERNDNPDDNNESQRVTEPIPIANVLAAVQPGT